MARITPQVGDVIEEVGVCLNRITTITHLGRVYTSPPRSLQYTLDSIDLGLSVGTHNLYRRVATYG